MNKCHFYLSSGLWEVVKCYFEPNSKIHNVYFWGMAVAPHHTCFASHIVCTPWQQSWATIKLLEYCLKKNQSNPQFDIFSASDLVDVSREIDFQYTLRNYASDPFVQTLFIKFAKPLELNGNNDIESDFGSTSFQQLLLLILKTCPSTAHCFIKQLAQHFPKLTDSVAGCYELSMIALGAIPDPLPFQRLAPLADSSYRYELFLLLLANGHASQIRRIEAEEQQKVADLQQEHLNQLLDIGVQPAKLFELMLVTNRHFVLYLLDLLQLNPPILENPCHIPKFLWPLLLLRHWGKSDTVESQTQFLIDKCKESTTDQVILRVCFMLEWYLNFSRWSASQGTEKLVGLESARDHSVLRLIHASADLTHADWTQVRALLHEPWDLQLLDGFSVHILLLRAMTASAYLRRERGRLCDAIDSEDRLQFEYKTEVTDRLSEIRGIVLNLRPLRFRLEVLENLFASLFLLWEDLPSVRLRRHSITEPRSPTSGRPANLSKGFVCNAHFLRDTLILIKESTAELERESKADDEIDIPCSIKPSQMENRLDRLSESLSEATWRLQIVTSPEFVADIGSIAFCHERFHFQPEWMVDSWQEPGKSKRRSCQEKREESGSQSPASGGEADKNAEKPPGPGFMHQMLASDWSLVVRCLSQNDVLNAEHIIGMMSTEESRQVLEGELNFTQAVTDVRRKLEVEGEFSSRRGSEVIKKSPRKSAGLQAVQQVAAEAVSATALTNYIERFLSTTTLPIFQGFSKLVPGSMPQCMDNSAAIVTLDLAIASTTSYQDFRDLYNLAGRHCPELTNRLQAPMGGTASPKPFGYIAFSQTLMSLLHELNKDKSINPSCFFRTRHIPFSLKTLKEQDNIWKQLRVFEQDLSKSKRESDLLNKDVAKGQKNIKFMQKTLESVGKITENAFETLEIGRNESVSNDTKIVNYCELLNRYLSDLATLSLDYITTKSGADNAVTFHTLLEQSAVEVLDRLVFQHHIDPVLLEKKAQQLGFNLCASLLWGCCPSIPQGPAFPRPLGQLLPDCLILNSFQKPYSDETKKDPATVVKDILSELLEAIRNLLNIKSEDDVSSCLNFISLKKLSSLQKEKTIISVLQRTQILQSINMAMLDEENHFSFFINISNLIILHCLLDGRDNSVIDGLCSPHLLVRETVVWYVGYQIGDLGFLSIGELKGALCGHEFSLPFSLQTRSSLLKSITSDPRTLFLIPALQVMNPGPRLILASNNISEAQLSKAVETYSKKYVEIEENHLKVSSFLGWYLDNVLMLKEAEGSSDISSIRSRRFATLIEFLVENTVDGEWRTALKSVSGKELVVNQEQSESGIFFDYCDHTHSSKLQTREWKSTDRWAKRSLTEPIIKQLSQNSRLLADLVVRLHEDQNDGDGRGLEMGKDVLLDERLRFLESLLAAPWIQTLAAVYNNNPILAALNKTPSDAVLWTYLNSCIEEEQWSQCWTIIEAIPDFSLHNDANLRRVRDLILYKMAAISKSDSGWTFAQLISDINIRIECVKVNYCYWPGDVVLKQFNSILRDEPNLTLSLASDIESNMNKIRVFIKIVDSCPDFESKSWFDIASMTVAEPKTVLESLLNYNKIETCVDWLNLPGVTESIISYIDVELMIRFAEILPGQLQIIFSSFPSDDFLCLCEEVIPKLTSLISLRNVSELCAKILRDEGEKSRFRKILLGIDLLSVLEDADQTQLAYLVSEPLLAIEQLVMNTRLDSLTVVLKKLRQLPNNGIISEKEVNDLLASYVSKAVEFKLIRVVSTSVRESFLMSPIITPNFEVPAIVPDKSQWVPDNEVSICMCCQLVTFSMFNRRHHCRRCGRVICASCSPHRIKVEGYDEVAVRVCQACYRHQLKPEGDMSIDTVDESSINEDTHYWSLTTDSLRNAAIRDEFAFEHAPNSSLCLSIFNLLPHTPNYTSLLLDESEKLLELLQSKETAANPEVDYTVLIKIIRALVIGAKVRYGQTGLTTGVVSCDRLLSQVDVVSLLVKNQCTRLIPSESLGGDTLRSLRDRLVEEELWDLAIELSTKAGLSLSGVWAAWGKVLLATGCWQEARQKFSQCLHPVASNLRNSPFLDEICHIIETTSFSSFQSGSTAQEVLERLSSLKSLSTGKVPVRGITGPSSVQYAEQEWYLTRYGNAAGLLKFYLRHENYRCALDLMLQRQLDPEVFVEYILLPTYRINAQECLKNAILAIDPSIESMKRYLIAACLILQKNQFLHYLHDIQLFMKDYVRAAMTCIQLYQGNGKNFSCLQELTHLLHGCLNHLDDELSAISKCVQRLDHVKKLDNREINRHKNTVCRQLEVTKFLAGCEAAGQSTAMQLTQLLWKEKNVPTLFQGQKSKHILAAVCVLAGKNVEEGFGLSFRIIQEYGLDKTDVYISVGKVLAQGRSMNLQQLADCIRTSGLEEFSIICDKTLVSALSVMPNNDQLTHAKHLVSLITNLDQKILGLISSRQLKDAYLIAVKHNKLALVQTILEEAEKNGQLVIRDICRKKLGLSGDSISTTSSAPSRESL